MEDIVTRDGYFRYRWYDDVFGNKGCDHCYLKGDEYCPKDKCNKDGCYVILSFEEMKAEHLEMVRKQQGKMIKK